MALRITGLAGRTRVACEEADAFERAARDVIPGDEDLDVGFAVWDGEDDGALRVVCKVETPPCDPLFDGPQWRLWSPLLATADELRTWVAPLVAARRAARAGRSTTPPRVEQAAGVGA